VISISVFGLDTRYASCAEIRKVLDERLGND